MFDPRKIQPKYNRNASNAVQPVSRSARKLWLAIAVLCIGVLNYWLLVHEPEAFQKADSRQSVNKVPPMPGDITPPPQSFEKRLEAALFAELHKNRIYAHQLFQELLEEATGFPKTDPRVPSILARAAGFYLKGKEIPQKEVESLFLEAIRAIGNVHDQVYYDYENMHRGLEQLYLSMGRYREAADQTRRLVDFYQRYHTNKDTRYALVLPTMVRLGDNRALAGQVEAARKAYKSALEMVKSRGSNSFFVNGIEERINKLNERAIQEH